MVRFLSLEVQEFFLRSMKLVHLFVIINEALVLKSFELSKFTPSMLVSFLLIKIHFFNKGYRGALEGLSRIYNEFIEGLLRTY